jgi:hypothetical protein
MSHGSYKTEHCARCGTPCCRKARLCAKCARQTLKARREPPPRVAMMMSDWQTDALGSFRTIEGRPTD